MNLKVGKVEMKDVNLLKENGIDIDSALEFLGDMEMYEETLNDFIEVSEKRMPRLAESFNSGDMKNYAIDVHALKSDSKYLGLTVLSDMALEHQTKAENNDIDYIKSHYEELVNDYFSTKLE